MGEKFQSFESTAFALSFLFPFCWFFRVLNMNEPEHFVLTQIASRFNTRKRKRSERRIKGEEKFEIDLNDFWLVVKIVYKGKTLHK